MDLNSTLSTIDFKFLPEQVNFYCEVNINSICRVCLEKNNSDKRMCNIFEGNEPLITMIMSCASVQVMQGDGLPNSICNKCLTKLNIAWQFKNQCENSDSRLRQYYANNTGNIEVQEVSSFDSIKQEVKSLLYDQMNSETNLVDFQNTTLYTDAQHQKNISNAGKVKNLETTKQKQEKQIEKTKVHQCDTCGKIFNRREYLTQHIRIHTGEKPYRCHLCEKRFVNSGHLTTHMRTHTGEKPHGCSLCPKAFSTRQELHKHTMVHNGERPFICTTCNKRFGSSSNLYSHLRHHTGEKNFTCEHCGKAFYTKQELKQHLVVHTGVKAFLCEICNKRFSQIAHLRRHSKIHL